jgi:hypothetical protein
VSIDNDLGDLEHVEEVIAEGDDLNEFVFQTPSDEFTLLGLAALNGHVQAVKKLLTIGYVEVDLPSKFRGFSPLFIACREGRVEIATALINHGADVLINTNDKETCLHIATARGHSEVVALLIENGATSDEKQQKWMGLSPIAVVKALEIAGYNRDGVKNVLRAYESEFQGKILDKRGGKCVVSWPGIYAKLWDLLVAGGKAETLSAAVVFLPEHTTSFGAHGEECHCRSMYGEVSRPCTPGSVDL